MNTKLQFWPTFIACLAAYFVLTAIAVFVIGAEASNLLTLGVVAFLSPVIAIPAVDWIRRKRQASGRATKQVD